MRNIAITGNAGSGKTTIANILISAGYTRVSFAEPIRNIARLAYGEIDKSKDYEVTGKDGVTTPISGRAILQKVGETIKQVDNLFFTKVFVKNAENLGSGLISDDMRFMHEYEALRAKGWLIVGLYCPDNVRIERLTTVYRRVPTKEELTHESEVEVPAILEKADIVIDSTLDPYINAEKILEIARQ